MLQIVPPHLLQSGGRKVRLHHDQSILLLCQTTHVSIRLPVM